MSNWLREFINEENGQGMVEYTLIVALIAIVATAGFIVIGNAAELSLEDSSNKIGAV